MSTQRNPWYSQAVFYEVFLRSFCDSNSDGWGDIPGLISKLDYLQWLGVNCIWLLPFFDSPLKDGGYDISNFYAIHPKYGTLEDFKMLIHEAHSRNIKVIGDLVLNHTSDQHPWFQEARDPKSPKHDWYVWSDTPDKYADLRVIFSDFETSNWEWDDTAQAYYLHRFFKFQPDLNYDNPEVQKEMLNITRYWLELGLDGFRLDAVPQLYEREGSESEGLPETHQVLRLLRAEVEKIKPGSLLLAEANQAPEALLAYFNDGDECNMAFHFPAMSEIFDMLRTGESRQFFATLAKTPKLPADCQWGTFLRSHDGITLKHLGSESRKQAFRDFYAPEPSMIIKGGVRRRLAPLCNFSLPKLKLAYMLMLSIPGTPVLYYGDEIGMGEDLNLRDRDPLRTPMPWDANKPNAGFSAAPAEELSLPLVDGPGGWRKVNVASQQANTQSLAHWLRKTLAIRHSNTALQLGSFTEIASDNPHIVSCIRRYGEEKLLVLINLTSDSQEFTLQDTELSSTAMRDLFTQKVQIPPATLAPYEYYWLAVQTD